MLWNENEWENWKMAKPKNSEWWAITAYQGDNISHQQTMPLYVVACLACRIWTIFLWQNIKVRIVYILFATLDWNNMVIRLMRNRNKKLDGDGGKMEGRGMGLLERVKKPYKKPVIFTWECVLSSLRVLCVCFKRGRWTEVAGNSEKIYGCVRSRCPMMNHTNVSTFNLSLCSADVTSLVGRYIFLLRVFHVSLCSNALALWYNSVLCGEMTTWRVAAGVARPGTLSGCQQRQNVVSIWRMDWKLLLELNFRLFFLFALLSRAFGVFGRKCNK